MVAGIVRYVWRHRRWKRCLGSCIDADRSRPQTERGTQLYAATERGHDRGRVTMRVCYLAVGMTLISGRRC